MIGPMASKSAILVSFEGPDGVGKTTNIKRLARELAFDGHSVVVVKLPAYNTTPGGIIKWMLKNGLAVSWPNLFQIVQCLDKLIFQWFVLPKLLKRYDYVLLDRWHASMWAYGLAGGASERLTNVCVNLMCEPHMVLVFHGTCKRQEAQDVYEKDKNFQKSVSLHYVLWTITHSENSRAIKADQPPAAVADEVLDAVYSIS